MTTFFLFEGIISISPLNFFVSHFPFVYLSKKIANEEISEWGWFPIDVLKSADS